jgi:hypothetical protein
MGMTITCGLASGQARQAASVSVRAGREDEAEGNWHKRFLGHLEKNTVGSGSRDRQHPSQGWKDDSCPKKHAGGACPDGDLQGAGDQSSSRGNQKTHGLKTELRENRALKTLVRANLLICKDVFRWLLKMG